ncbi:uncharacterized protein B0I36DRAFT_312304 [Microdochium trichocladiopsis]|uniref:Uncharacterized protein n=1 Tax=Microdochium trichocladiopsis TaxID=1682393 RepID=A0A9P8YJS9_9PEZI|nr:uncharacterized protein B0I36DRAFT_312304 [Microdochium trichocladiopsis]KAH7041178.1 hypothetical protein B0I36DRAFT_312304 [Microdochium trichocladiopsis]
MIRAVKGATSPRSAPFTRLAAELEEVHICTDEDGQANQHCSQTIQSSHHGYLWQSVPTNPCLWRRPRTLGISALSSPATQSRAGRLGIAVGLAGKRAWRRRAAEHCSGLVLQGAGGSPLAVTLGGRAGHSLHLCRHWRGHGVATGHSQIRTSGNPA